MYAIYNYPSVAAADRKEVDPAKAVIVSKEEWQRARKDLDFLFKYCFFTSKLCILAGLRNRL
jgi:hypothetical protein